MKVDPRIRTDFKKINIILVVYHGTRNSAVIN